MSVWYLDLDDEITDAVARLRAAQDSRVVLVIPPGSRIGTGRINFRLLAREAQARRLTVAVASADAQVRAMAAAAGLLARDTATAAEAALTPGASAGGATDAASLAADAMSSGDSTPVTMTPGGSGTAVATRSAGLGARLRGRGRAADSPPQTYAMTPRAASAALTVDGAMSADTSVLTGERARSRSAVARRRRVAGWGVRLTALGGLLVGGSYAAYLVFPSATIVLQARAETFGPMVVEITAREGVGAPDVGTGLVPVVTLSLMLDADGTFDATDRVSVRERATGSAQFTNANTSSPVTVPEGTRVATQGGVQFETTTVLLIPHASFAAGPQRKDVPIRAVEPGKAGNVAAGTITKIMDDTLVKALLPEGGVTNPDPTQGGSEKLTAKVSKSDYMAAQDKLRGQLQAQLDAKLADPLTTPNGLTLYRATTDLGNLVFDPQKADVVDKAVESPGSSFLLSVSTTATVLAVNEQMVRDTAAEWLKESVPPNTRIVYTDTAVADVGTPEVGDREIVYTVSVSADSYVPLDGAAIVKQVKGKSVSEATSILGKWGTPQVTVWPDFLPNLPDDVHRITLNIKEPQVSQP